MIELFANRFYYSVYCSVVKFAHAMDFIARPLKWLFATFFWFVPCLRKRLQRQGKTREKVIQEAMSITMDGVSMKTKKDYGIAYLLDADDVIDTFFFFFTSSLIMIPQLFIPFRYVRYIVTNIWLFLVVILFCIFSACRQVLQSHWGEVQGLLQTFRQVQEERTTPQSSYQSWSCHIGFVGMVCTNLVLPPLTDAITSFSPFCKSSNHVKRYWKQNILFNLLQRYLSEVIFNHHIIAFNYQTTSFLPSRMYIPRAGLACSWRPWRSKRVWRPDELGECGLSIPAGFVSTTCRPESSWVCDVLRQKWGKNRLLDVI